MTDFAALELPIIRIKIKGPAARALETRREANNHHRVKAEELRNAYLTVRPSILTGLKALASRAL